MKSDTAHASGRSVRRRLGTKVPRDGKTEVGRKISKLLSQVHIPKYGGGRNSVKLREATYSALLQSERAKTKVPPPERLGLYTYIDPRH